MLQIFKEEEKIENSNILRDKVQRIYDRINKNGWELVNISTFETKIWDYPEYHKGMCFMITVDTKGRKELTDEERKAKLQELKRELNKY